MPHNPLFCFPFSVLLLISGVINGLNPAGGSDVFVMVMLEVETSCLPRWADGHSLGLEDNVPDSGTVGRPSQPSPGVLPLAGRHAYIGGLEQCGSPSTPGQVYSLPCKSGFLWHQGMHLAQCVSPVRV